MNIKFIIGVFALAFVYSCTAKKAIAPKEEVTEVKEIREVLEIPLEVAMEPVSSKLTITAATLAEGKSLYGMNCAKCHDLYNPKTFSAEEWTPIIMSMQKKAEISDEQREKIYAYLTTPQM
jgi:cytochrome c5